MKTGTVKTSSLLCPKRKKLLAFGESVTDADVENFDELVEAGFIEGESVTDADVENFDELVEAGFIEVETAETVKEKPVKEKTEKDK